MPPSRLLARPHGAVGVADFGGRLLIPSTNYSGPSFFCVCMRCERQSLGTLRYMCFMVAHSRTVWVLSEMPGSLPKTNLSCLRARPSDVEKLMLALQRCGDVVAGVYTWCHRNYCGLHGQNRTMPLIDSSGVVPVTVDRSCSGFREAGLLSSVSPASKLAMAECAEANRNALPPLNTGCSRIDEFRQTPLPVRAHWP